MAEYRILDEPRPGRLSAYVVAPFWPLLALMLGGAWVGWPWFVFNAVAMGSATRVREIGVSVLGIALCAATVAVLLAFDAQGMLTKETAAYALIVPVVCKLAAAYVVVTWQARSFELFQYFGGADRSGILVVVAATMWGNSAVRDALKDSLFARLVLL